MSYTTCTFFFLLIVGTKSIAGRIALIVITFLLPSQQTNNFVTEESNILGMSSCMDQVMSTNQILYLTEFLVFVMNCWIVFRRKLCGNQIK